MIATRASRARARLRPRPTAPPAHRLLRWLTPRLEAADLPWPAADALRIGAAGSGLAVVAALLVAGPLLAGLAALTLAVGGPIALRALGGRRDRRIERELPALLEAVARGLRSGAALPTALAEAAGTGTAAAADLRHVLGEVDRGAGLGAALAGWATWRPLPGVRLVAGALVVALEVGGAPARAVDGVAATLRERVEVDREVRALGTQARSSAAVVTLAPIAFALLGALGDGKAAAFLLGTGPGLACLAAGLALDGLGAWWMARITRSVT